MRLLAKLDRRRTAHPVPKMHGYYISADGLAILMEMMTSSTKEERALIPGMNRRRTHSIVGGALIAQALITHTGAKGIIVSGQGCGRVWLGIRALYQRARLSPCRNAPRSEPMA